MRIAIVGAGFSGLSTAWHLLNKESCEVFIFDAKGIGGGASGMAAGLMHPYVGEEGRRSHLATEGMAASRELIDRVEEKSGKKVANREGILRYMLSEEQTQRYFRHCTEYGDVEPDGEGCFWIKSGMTVDCPAYLEGLWELLSERGATLVQEEVSCLSFLKDYDEVIVAAGAGMLKFPELSHLIPNATENLDLRPSQSPGIERSNLAPISNNGDDSIAPIAGAFASVLNQIFSRVGYKCYTVKGQVLLCTVPDSIQLPPVTRILKGYIAPSGIPGHCTIGSTYERGLSDDLPDPHFARADLFPKVAPLFAKADQLKIADCKAGLRVVRKGHYFPIIAQVRSGLWVIGAMGSRGLLYHAFAGKLLAEAILYGG